MVMPFLAITIVGKWILGVLGVLAILAVIILGTRILVGVRQQIINELTKCRECGCTDMIEGDDQQWSEAHNGVTVTYTCSGCGSTHRGPSSALLATVDAGAISIS